MSVATAIIKIDGVDLDSTYTLTQVDIIWEINRIPFAQLTLVDGDPTLQAFRLSDSGTFNPGAEVEIIFRYEGMPETETSVFKGIIVKHCIEADQRGTFLILDLKDSAVKMTSQRKKNIFNDLSDAEVIQQLIEDNGLEVKETVDTPVQHAELIQYWSTDWDFLLTRADVNGLLILVEQGQVSMADPTALVSGAAQHSFEYGVDSIYSLKFEANAEGQYETVTATAWNIQDQSQSEPEEAEDFSQNLGDLEPSALAQAAGTGTFELNSSLPLPPEELQAWANSKLRKSRMAMIKGRITVPGKPDIKPLEILELAGTSDRFNGTAIITGIRHRFTANGWLTDIQFGHSSKWFTSKSDIIVKPASGLLPAVQGMQIGKVAAFEEDPEGELRIKVQIPALGGEALPVWARLLSAEAGNERGYFFLPEEGDEVVLGFLNDDPRHPVILGGLYSSVNVPPIATDEITADNFIKGIYTKTGMSISFDDENQGISILTSDSQSIALNESESLLEIKDVNGNLIQMNESAITIQSAGDLNIEASGKVVIKGSEVDVQ